MSQLEVQFSEEEVKFSVYELGTNRSPGPDGFMAEFFQMFWNILKSDIMIVFKDFFFFAFLFFLVFLRMGLSMPHLI